MFHYLFTNDLRISHLADSLVEAGTCFKNNSVPSASEDKNANNNMNTLGFYFNLTPESLCSIESSKGNIRAVVLNFIKKFQFPNPRTKNSFDETSADGIKLAPMRIILKILYVMNMQEKTSAYLTKDEIADFIFFNSDVAKKENIDFLKLIDDIKKCRSNGIYPNTIEKNPNARLWKQETRQVREMVKVLTWAGCVKEDSYGNLTLSSIDLTVNNKADLYDILTYEKFWEPSGTDFKDIKKSYQEYMDIESIDEEKNISDMEIYNNSLKYNTNISIAKKRNRIIFGAPGTGKSFTLNKEKNDLLSDGGNCERVTFHPDYSYANFVGAYKPTMTAVSNNVDPTQKNNDVIKVLSDSNKTAQEKYDLLYETFKDDGLTRLPILLGLYTDETFKTRKADGTDAVGDNSVERNHGRAIRQYVELLSKTHKKEEISYEYVPGPFMRTLVAALKSGMTDNPKPYLLIVEEINRANVAAVFGDVFQLLDRDKTNISEYEISTSNDMRKYLASELQVDETEVQTIKLPDNMFIWATMNSADQGVFPMDTAFKRRWNFTYLGIDDALDDMSDNIKNKKYIFGKGDFSRILSWNDLRIEINNELSSEDFNVNEDKLLGPYFISKSVLEADEQEFMDVFKNKVLMYLFDDAVKQKRNTFFSNCRNERQGVRYSEICKKFDKKGIFIFNENITKRFKSQTRVSEVEES